MSKKLLDFFKSPFEFVEGPDYALTNGQTMFFSCNELLLTSKRFVDWALITKSSAQTGPQYGNGLEFGQGLKFGQIR